MKEKNCPCGNGCMDLRLTHEKTVFNKIEIDFEAEKYICHHCGLEASTIEQAARIQKYIADLYRLKTGLLAGPEISNMRSAAGLTREQLAVLMNVPLQTIAGWETCAIQTRYDDKALRKILKGPGSYEVI